MSNYVDVKFEAELNEFGIEVITDLYRTCSWAKTVALYPTSHPSIFAGITDGCNVIPFSPHSSLKDIESNNLKNGIWSVCIVYKFRSCEPDNIIHNLLQYLIAKPCTVNRYHELWDDPKITIIQPKEIKE